MSVDLDKIFPSRQYCRKEAAELIGVHCTTLDNYTKQGLIVAHISRRNGRRWWKGSDLIRLMK